MKDSFATRAVLEIDGQRYAYASLAKLGQRFDLRRLPYSMKILLENLLRHEDGVNVTAREIEAVANWDAKAEPATEIAFMPARVVLQDFTGVPCVVDLAAMRDAMVRLGGDPKRINPLAPAELVIDHSVQVDDYGTAAALDHNVDIEFRRNGERYSFLRWGQKAFNNFKVVPPRTGIVHQVNLEHLARVVMTSVEDGTAWAYPDTVFGTDSHTTMINGLGVLGWGVGGIEAEAAMLGQASSMLIPQVVGFKLDGRLPEGATATDLVLTVTQMLRKLGVVGKFVEFFGPGLRHLALADRATIGNMAPEYGATCGIFPVDAEALNYLRLSGRSAGQIALVEAYARAQGLWHDEHTPQAEFSATLELDLATVRPSLAGPKRPQDRVLLGEVRTSYLDGLKPLIAGRKPRNGDAERFAGEGGASAVGNAANAMAEGSVRVEKDGHRFELRDGAVVIAAITSCTNTSNPSVMIGAGLVAKRAVERGLKVQPWVKTSLAPGSQVVTDYLEKADVAKYLDKLGFNLVGYGCTTCIGNSGPLPEAVSDAINTGDLVAVSVLSGNRNFEGRVHPLVRANYLASPMLVVAYALAGSMNINLTKEPVGYDKNNEPVYLKDIWPSPQEIAAAIRKAVKPSAFRARYSDVFEGTAAWRKVKINKGSTYAWDARSTYVKRPPYFEGMTAQPAPVEDIKGARILALFGDSITTDHISPAGSIKKDSPAGRYLLEHGVKFEDFNSYGSRRGNDEVMVRGTFANIRIKNEMMGGREGGLTRHQPSGEEMSIFDAAMRYRDEGIPVVVIGGKEYGTGSSRDWAAKGPKLQGVRAVITESFERIHRSNLIGMGIAPLVFEQGKGRKDYGLTGAEIIDIPGLRGPLKPRSAITATIHYPDGSSRPLPLLLRIDTADEVAYFTNGGILQYVLRSLNRTA